MESASIPQLAIFVNVDQDSQGKDVEKVGLSTSCYN